MVSVLIKFFFNCKIRTVYYGFNNRKSHRQKRNHKPLCILFILGSSFLSYIIPSLKSQIFSIGLTLFGYICFIFTNWILLKRFCLSHKLIKYFILYVLSNLIISTFFVQGWDNWGLYFTHTSILFLPIWSYLVQSKQKENIFRSY